jgi:beta-lactamase regulating signal transducer with metallopeptidase domain
MLPEGLALAPLVRVLGWSLLHSLWQGAVVTLALAALLASLRRRGASLRYWVAYGGLLLTFILPAATAWRLASLPEAVEFGPAAARAALAGTSVPVTAGEPPHIWTAVARPALDYLLPWMVGGWTLGVMIHSVRLAGGYVQVTRLRRLGIVPAPERWQQVFAGLVRRLRVSAPVRLLVSTKVLVPTACGWLRPAVIVPVSALTAIPVEQVESILAHELAHIRRHDFLLNLVQSVIEILLFYHPGVRWLSARINAERENCCDDVAVAACGDPRVYARALAGFEHLRASALPGPALAATGGPLLQRIRRLIAPPAVPAGGLGSRLAAAVLLLGAMSFTGLTVVVRAQLPGEAARTASAGMPATLPARVYSLQEELRLEQACGDSGKLRRCVDAAAGEVRFECVPGSPLALLLWSLGERRQDDGAREVRREVPPPSRQRPAPETMGRESGQAAVRQRQQQTKIVQTHQLPRCGAQR